MSDTTTIISAVIIAGINGFVAITVAKIANKQNKISKQINGQQTLLLEVTKKASIAEGNLAGREELKVEQANQRSNKKKIG